MKGTNMLLLLVLIKCYIQCVATGSAEGQKAHFQVHDKKQGTLSIHATKTQAKITATADSVQMVVDPGTEEIPQDSVSSAKRDEIRTSHKLVTSSKRKSFKKFQLKQNAIHRKKTSKTHDINASKKSIVDKEMRVHAQSGAMHVHTDHNYTAVNSESGKLEVYIKNPEHYTDQKVATHHDNIRVNVHTEETYKKSHMLKTPRKLHITNDVTGLKKSIVNTKKKGGKRSKMTPCLIPPCST